MTLYLKYRPQTIEELDLAKVRESLHSIGSSESIPHAFLFSGPRGSGKTSAARILAKLINCENPVKTNDGYLEPCNKCDQCISINTSRNMDIIELDAASNRGIDDIRQLRERVALVPASAKKKIYILDEAHMLTTEAANALLKTLEEPPDHVLFILATTEPDKIPETGKSRLTHVVFEKANNEEVVRQLTRVAKGEGATVDESVLFAIAAQTDGSFREAVKIFEELVMRFGKSFTDADLAKLDNFNTKLIASEILESVAQGSLSAAFEKLSLYEKNASTGGVIQLVDTMIMNLRSELLISAGVSAGEQKTIYSAEEAIRLINALLDAKSKLHLSPLASLQIELALLTVVVSKPAPPLKKKILEDVNTGEPLSAEAWNKILLNVREKNASVEALLRAAKPLGISGNVFNLGVYYQFHKERLEVTQMRKILEETIAEVIGGNVTKVECSLTQRPKGEIKKDPPLTEQVDEDIIAAAK